MTATGPLADVRVLDCTQMLAGPFATQALADLGAEVIKVERPGIGDITRSVEPEIGSSGLTAYFAALNRGKRSVELDLGSETGAAAFDRLADTADVVVENYRPGTMAKFGLGPDDLLIRHPDLIYCSISGFLEGPYRDLAAFDMVAQALSGSMSVTGEADGPPVRPGIPIGDISAGMYAVAAVSAALYSRDRLGGMHLEVPMFEGLVSWLTERAGRTFVTGEPYPRMGTVHPSLAPYRTFETADGWLALAVASQGTWASFCDAIDRPDLTDDPRFETNADRVENRETLAEIVAPVLADDTADAWFERFRAADVPAAPVRNTVEVFEDPQIRDGPVTSDLAIDGIDLPFVELPVVFSETETGAERPPPHLGAHTEAVLSDVLSESALADVLEGD